MITDSNVATVTFQLKYMHIDAVLNRQIKENTKEDYSMLANKEIKCS